jgi:hypothetical protein
MSKLYSFSAATTTRLPLSVRSQGMVLAISRFISDRAPTWYSGKAMNSRSNSSLASDRR